MFFTETEENVCSFCCKNNECDEYEKFSCVILNNHGYDDICEEDLAKLFP